ncbi:MAG: hypothetical protein EAZ30_02795 [Betaproteobacteria bacterium]|nr:MAG: hypothetical protein EAZ30_02795 [Betaproteobacteria bacterium]
MRDRYPSNGTQIREQRLAKAQHRCEHCRVPDRAIGYRNIAGDFVPLGVDADAPVGCKRMRIVLTIAHLYDPSPENVAEDNLAALCQKCHNTLDAPMRARNARNTRRNRKAIGELF